MGERRNSNENDPMRTQVDQETFNDWCLRLDAHLMEMGVATRCYHFRLPALLFGYVTEMEPNSFVQDAWDRDVTELPVWSAEVNQLSLRKYLEFSRLNANKAESVVDAPEPHFNHCPVCGASDWCAGELNAGH